MGEADEIADSMRAEFKAIAHTKEPSMDVVRKFVRDRMPGESKQMIDNVVWSLMREE